VAAACVATPEFGISARLDGNTLNRAIDFQRAYAKVADELELFTKGLRDTLAEHRYQIGTQALVAYSIAKSFARPSDRSAFVPHLTNINHAAVPKPVTRQPPNHRNHQQRKRKEEKPMSTIPDTPVDFEQEAKALIAQVHQFAKSIQGFTFAAPRGYWGTLPAQASGSGILGSLVRRSTVGPPPNSFRAHEQSQPDAHKIYRIHLIVNSGTLKSLAMPYLDV
jgi:hypothetical protein